MYSRMGQSSLLNLELMKPGKRGDHSGQHAFDCGHAVPGIANQTNPTPASTAYSQPHVPSQQGSFGMQREPTIQKGAVYEGRTRCTSIHGPQSFGDVGNLLRESLKTRQQDLPGRQNLETGREPFCRQETQRLIIYIM